MTDTFANAREAARMSLCEMMGLDAMSCTHHSQAYLEHLDTALSAFEAHGYVLVPKEPTEHMLLSVRNDRMTMKYYDSKDAERDAKNRQKYTAMIAQAIKERT